MFQASRLRAMRQRAGLTQAELAKRIGKSQGYVGDLERGNRTGLTADTLESLARALGCSTDFLMGLTEDEEHDAAA